MTEHDDLCSTPLPTGPLQPDAYDIDHSAWDRHPTYKGQTSHTARPIGVIQTAKWAMPYVPITQPNEELYQEAGPTYPTLSGGDIIDSE